MDKNGITIKPDLAISINMDTIHTSRDKPESAS
jgi:hypothetical protein